MEGEKFDLGGQNLAKKAILRPKIGPRGRFWRPKWPGGIVYEDFWERSVEWRRPIAKLESSEYSLEYGKIPYAGHP